MIYEFSPKQDLHGWEKPWAPGANINICDPEEGFIRYSSYNKYVINDDNTVTITGNALLGLLCKVEPSTAYFASLRKLPGRYSMNLRIREYSEKPTAWESASFITQSVNNYFTTETGTASFTTNENTTYIALCIFRQGDISRPEGVTIDQWYVQKGGDAILPYTPYANVCMPEGYNIWDPSTAEMIPVYSGYVDTEARKLYLHPVYEEYTAEELVGPWMSSLDPYEEDTTPTEGAVVIDFGGDLTEYEITAFMLQTLLDSLGIRRFITSGAMLLNSLMDQAQGRVRSEEELLNRSLPIHVIAIGEDLPTNLVIKKPISDVLPGLPGKIKI